MKRSKSILNEAYNELLITKNKLKELNIPRQLGNKTMQNLIESDLSNKDFISSIKLSKINPRLTQYELRKLRYEQRKLKKRVNDELKYLENANEKRLGKLTNNKLIAVSDDEFRLKRLLEISEDTYKDKGSTFNFEEEYKRLKNLTKPKPYKLYQERGINLLENLGKTIGVEDETINELIKEIKKLSPRKYQRFYQEERILNKLIHAYRDLNLLNGTEYYDYYVEEYYTDFNELVDNIKDIIKEYK